MSFNQHKHLFNNQCKNAEDTKGYQKL